MKEYTVPQDNNYIMEPGTPVQQFIPIPEGATRADVFRIVFGFPVDIYNCVTDTTCIVGGQDCDLCPLQDIRCNNLMFAEYWKGLYKEEKE